MQILENLKWMRVIGQINSIWDMDISWKTQCLFLKHLLVLTLIHLPVLLNFLTDLKHQLQFLRKQNNIIPRNYDNKKGIVQNYTLTETQQIYIQIFKHYEGMLHVTTLPANGNLHMIT